ncbi:hypothetical protein PC112_g8697 [Phytophthora cactorum]|nr:hypothetical protein PC112_g8697 [Phytophthora cactorum]
MEDIRTAEPCSSVFARLNMHKSRELIEDEAAVAEGLNFDPERVASDRQRRRADSNDSVDSDTSSTASSREGAVLDFLPEDEAPSSIKAPVCSSAYVSLSFLPSAAASRQGLAALLAR